MAVTGGIGGAGGVVAHGTPEAGVHGRGAARARWAGGLRALRQRQQVLAEATAADADEAGD